MTATAKLFTTGRSQAVRLPKDFRFDGDEVFIRRDEVTGEVILSPKPETLGDFLKTLRDGDVPADFMADRDDSPTQAEDIF